MRKTKSVWTIENGQDSCARYLYRGGLRVVYVTHSLQLGDELSTILLRGQEKPRTCVWTIDTVEGCVTTECEHVIVWEDDPRSKAHGIRYCHSCGGRVKWKVAK